MEDVTLKYVTKEDIEKAIKNAEAAIVELKKGDVSSGESNLVGALEDLGWNYFPGSLTPREVREEPEH